MLNLVGITYYGSISKCERLLPFLFKKTKQNKKTLCHQKTLASKHAKSESIQPNMVGPTCRKHAGDVRAYDARYCLHMYPQISYALYACTSRRPPMYSGFICSHIHKLHTLN